MVSPYLLYSLPVEHLLRVASGQCNLGPTRYDTYISCPIINFGCKQTHVDPIDCH